MNISFQLLPRRSVKKNQLGVTTLAITLLLLAIITLMVLFSASVSFFEQRTTTNENRARLAEQAAETAVNISGEFLKSNISNIATTGSGWLGSTGTRRWSLCSSVSSMPATHPCMAERNANRRAELYYYSFGGVDAIPYSTIPGALTNIGGAAGNTFPVTSVVGALLCRLDTTLTVGTVKSPDCRAIPNPTSANRIAITVIANASLTGENSSAVVKETWVSINTSLSSSAVPLVASGTVKGLGTATIVTAPNGGGYGVPVSVWSPCPVAFNNGVETISSTGCTAPANGNGSVQTCQLEAFLNNGLIPVADLKSTCASGNSCGCPNSGIGFLSGGGASKVEREDILDRDGGGGFNAQGQPIPDITFYPTNKTTTVGGNSLDNDFDPLDDSMFEWVFGQDIMAEDAATVGTCNTENCALVALRDKLNATILPGCNTLGPTSSGLYYITGTCNFPNNTNIGSATSPVVVVVNGDDSGNKPVSFSKNFFGMLFIRSNNNSAEFSSNGGRFFGSIVVEGDVDLNGNVYIVYDNSITNIPGQPLPLNTRFAKVTGSWLDAAAGF